MQGPAPTATVPETRTGSSDKASSSKATTSTSTLDRSLVVEASSSSHSTAAFDQDQAPDDQVPDDQVPEDQVPDDQAEIAERVFINEVTVTDHRPPVLESLENPARPAPPPTYVPTQNDAVDELVAGVEALQVQETDAFQVHYQIVLTRDLDPSIRIVNRRFSNRRRHRLTGIPGRYSVIVTRNGVSLAYDNIHYPEAYIAQCLMNEGEM